MRNRSKLPEAAISSAGLYRMYFRWGTSSKVWSQGQATIWVRGVGSNLVLLSRADMALASMDL